MNVTDRQRETEKENERTFGQKYGAKTAHTKKTHQHFIYDERCAFIHREYDAYVNAIIMLASQEKCDQETESESTSKRKKWAEMKKMPDKILPTKNGNEA